MLDTAKLLRLSREAKQTISLNRNFRQKPADWRKTVYINLDVQLGLLADQLGWFKGWQNMPAMAINATTINNYVQTLNLFLWIAQVEQWTHLVVLEESELTKLAKMPKRDLNAHYLGIKSMLWNCYLQGDQASFKHAWHSIIKFGLVELALKQDFLQQAFEEQINTLVTD